MYLDCRVDLCCCVNVIFQVKLRRGELQSRARVVPITLEQVTVLELKTAININSINLIICVSVI